MASAGMGLVLLCAAACSAKSGGAETQRPRGPQVVPAVVGTAVQRDVPIDVSNIGTVEALATVQVKSQVGGQLLKVNFHEGDEVKAGDVLFEIDPRPYQVALDQARSQIARQQALKRQAEANRQKDEAQLQNARQELDRIKTLLGKGIASQDEFDKATTAEKSAAAAVASDEAAIATAEQGIVGAQADIDSAQLSLSYCTLKAPISGKLGSLLVDQGNLVKANGDGGLVVINQMQPIYVSFALPERYLGQVNQQRAKGPLAATVALPDSGTPVSTGTLTFVDNEVDPDTGTIRLKARFPNEDERLWPGQFVNVSLRLGEIPDAVVVPSRAIMTGQSGQYVYVVGGEETVHARTVETGRDLGTEVIVTSGLKAGERIVLDGQMRLVDGSKIAPKQSLTQSGPTADAGEGS